MAERDNGAWRDNVIHSVFKGPSVLLYADDGADSEPMKGCALLIQNDDPTAAEALFAAMSESGRVTAPFKQPFWAIFTAISPTGSASNGRRPASRRRERFRPRLQVDRLLRRRHLPANFAALVLGGVDIEIHHAVGKILGLLVGEDR